MVSWHLLQVGNTVESLWPEATFRAATPSIKEAGGRFAAAERDEVGATASKGGKGEYKDRGMPDKNQVRTAPARIRAALLVASLEEPFWGNGRTMETIRARCAAHAVGLAFAAACMTTKMNDAADAVAAMKRI